MSIGTMGSLFDGSGGFPLAASMCGIEPRWASEIEPYTIAVTRARFPFMTHLGDITGINGAKIEPVDIITFGSPCQDMSIAGKRAGLKHKSKGDGETTRSGLFLEAVRIIKEMRDATNGKYPKYVLWENVPGAYTSNKGWDFLAVLQAIAEIARSDIHVPRPAHRGKDDRLDWKNAGCIVGDGWSAAWRTLDAQYWGVPQRRRRIYLVADFTGDRAGKILFERDGMSGDIKSSPEARQGAAEDAEGGAGGSNCAWLSFHLQQDPISSEAIAPCLSGQHQASVGVAFFMGGQGSKAGGLGYAEEVAPTLKAAPSGSNAIADVVYAINDNATRNRGGGPTRHDDGAGNGLGVQDDGVMYTLDTASKHAVCYPETARCLTARHDGSPCADRGPDVICHSAGFNDATGERAQGSMEYCEERSPTLRAGDVRSVVYDARGNVDGSIVPTLTGDHQIRVSDYTAVCVGNGQLHNISMADQMNTLDCMHDQQAVLTSGKPPRRYIVRRLTPLECCRLQGFPDGWGDIPLRQSIPDDEAEFWENVRNTHARATGKKYIRLKTKSALLKWYNKLHTDSAEYRMWGNGITLSCGVYVMDGIAQEIKEVM